MTGLSNSKGLPTGAIFGFTNMLLSAMRGKQPAKMAVVFDAKGPTFRHEKGRQDKANWPPAPDDLIRQIPRIHELVEAFRLPVLMVPGFEADDVIATLASAAKEEGQPVVIVSGDKDLMQLVGEGVTMWDPQKDKVYDPAAVAEKWGALPEKLLDLFALIGDVSDNIPGVPGIGPKTAATLIEQFGSLEAILSNLDKVTQKRAQTSLANNKDQALLSRDLIRLDHHVPLQVTIDDLSVVEPDTDRLRELFKEFEFKRFLADLPATKGLDYSGYVTVTTPAQLEELVRSLRRIGTFAVDTETTSTEPVRADLVGISVAAEAGKAFYIPVGHDEGKQLPKEEVLRKIGPLLEDETLGKIGQNIKYDMIVLKKEGMEIRGVVCDTMLALSPSRSRTPWAFTGRPRGDLPGTSDDPDQGPHRRG